MSISYTNLIQNGTLTVNAQPNITSVGTLTSLTVNGVSNLGPPANVDITGGSFGYILGTGGNADLNWIPGQLVYFTNYNITANGAPVYANSTASRLIPLTFVGSDPGANYVWPFYQNTSTTANGYQANSTSSFNPDGAAVLTGNILSNTITGDWYQVSSTVFSDSNNFIVSSIQTLRVYANVADVEYQIVPYVGYLSNNNIRLETDRIETYTTDAAVPKTSVSTSFFSFTNTGNYDVMGYYIRNITANSELTVYACEQQTSIHI